MENRKLKEELIKEYQNMDVEIHQDDRRWSTRELAGYFLYNCSLSEIIEEFENVKEESVERQEAWKLIKKVIFPY